MEMYDHFGQKTTIRLSRFERNPATQADTYTFSIPDGADVVTE
jgi:outer membrane lipoprotein-sorting protein